MGKQRNLDVWIVESNTVYKAVPFTVVADWTQQGRLLADDQLRVTGTDKWVKLGNAPALCAYLPRVEPHRANDQAEALERVELDFTYRKRADEDDDVDMIPLIDISLVLLIFFMMTTTVVVAGSGILVPETEHGSVLAEPDMIWIGIDKIDDQPQYSIGQGEGPPQPGDSKLDEQAVLAKIKERLTGLQEAVEIRITAHKDLSYDVVKRMTVALEPYRQKRKISVIRAEVNEKKAS